MQGDKCSSSLYKKQKICGLLFIQQILVAVILKYFLVLNTILDQILTFKAHFLRKQVVLIDFRYRQTCDNLVSEGRLLH